MSQYDQHYMIGAFKDVMPKIRESGDPEGSLLKYASDKNFPPAVLEKLAQVYNTAKTLHNMDKAETPEDRGNSFPIIDTDSLLARYVDWTPPKAAAVVSAWNSDGWLETDTVKAASAGGILIEDDVPDIFGPLIGITRLDISHVDEPVKAAAAPMVKRAQDIERELVTLTDVASEAVDRVRTLFERQKIAAFKNPELVGEMFLDLGPDRGVAGQHMLRQFTDYLKSAGIKQVPFEEFEEKRIIREDRHKAAAWLDEILALREQVETVALYGELQAKQAAVDPAVLAALRGKAKPMIIPDAGDTIGAAAEGAEISRTRPIGSSGDETSSDAEDPPPSVGKSEAPEDTQSKKEPETKKDTPKSKLDVSQLRGRPVELKSTSSQISQFADALFRQKRIEDSATEHLTSATIIQRLLLSDPILSAADPDDVVSQFNTIRKANPAIASDPNLLTFALREAVQYGGMPLHTYEQLLNTKERKQDDKTDGKNQPGAPKLNLNLLGI